MAVVSSCCDLAVAHTVSGALLLMLVNYTYLLDRTAVVSCD